MHQVEGKTIFITGGARGIGLGIARAFARAGAKLALADIDQTSLTLAKSELSKLTPVETFLLDVRDRWAFAGVADETESRLGPVSILCNNAGVGGEPDVSRLTYEHWDWILGINLNGVINGIQTFLPRMIRRGGDAHIVNTASGGGLAATASGLLYTTSKFAVVGLSEFLRLVLEPSEIGSAFCAPVPSIRRSSPTAEPRGPRSRGLPRNPWLGKLSPRFRLPEPILTTWAKWFSRR